MPEAKHLLYLYEYIWILREVKLGRNELAADLKRKGGLMRATDQDTTHAHCYS